MFCFSFLGNIHYNCSKWHCISRLVAQSSAANNADLEILMLFRS